jgi:hypothetical protein
MECASANMQEKPKIKVLTLKAGRKGERRYAK